MIEGTAQTRYRKIHVAARFPQIRPCRCMPRALKSLVLAIVRSQCSQLLNSVAYCRLLTFDLPFSGSQTSEVGPLSVVFLSRKCANSRVQMIRLDSGFVAWAK